MRQKTIHDVGPLKTITASLDMLLAEEGEQRLLLITGEQGTGKSFGAKLWCQSHRDESIYIEAPPSSCLPIGQRLLLVFDEADRMRGKDPLDVLRYIHDQASAKIAFISVPALRESFLSRPELKGRVVLSPQLKPLTRGEVRKILPDLADAVADAIYDASGGRIREVLVLSGHTRRLKDENRTPENVGKISRQYTLSAQVA